MQYTNFMFSVESLQQLRERMDLVTCLERYLPLKRMGASYKACCPFHQEKTPSFTVKRGDTHYHCYGCGAHGDAIAFLMQYQHLSFAESVETLAEMFHVPLQKEEQDPEALRQARGKEILEYAAAFYQFYLLYHPEGHQGLAYLYRRRCSLEFATQYHLGFAPYQEGLFLRWMTENRVTPTELKEVGLLNGAGREFFQGRILFPIYNTRGGIVGFSGRKIREETFGGKYINTPETLLFKKSHTLFGLHLARRAIAKKQEAILVEGQMDCLKLLHAGFEETVAALGTAFGVGHRDLLLQLGVKRVYVVFDGDSAGQKAASKVGDLFQSVGIEVLVTPLPDQSDPDSFLQTKGAQALQVQLESSVPYLKFQYHYLLTGMDAPSPAQKHQVVHALAEQIRGWQEPIMVHEALKQVAQLAQVPLALLPSSVPLAPSKEHESMPLSKICGNRILEVDLLRCLLLTGSKRGSFLATAQRYLSPSWLQDPACRDWYQMLIEKPVDLILLGNRQPELMEELLARTLHLDRVDKQFLDTLRKLIDRQWATEKQRLSEQIARTVQDEERLLLTKQFVAYEKSRPRELVLSLPPSAPTVMDTL